MGQVLVWQRDGSCIVRVANALVRIVLQPRGCGLHHNVDISNCKWPWAMGLGMGTGQVAGAHGRCNLEWGQTKLQAVMCDRARDGDKSNCRRPWAIEPEVMQITLQAAMGDGAWNGDKPNCRPPCAMKFGTGTNRIAGGHGRGNMEWRQTRLQGPGAMEPGMGPNQNAGGHGRWNLEWGQTKLQAAMGDGTWNGDKSNCRRPRAMELAMGTRQIPWPESFCSRVGVVCATMCRLHC